MKQVMPSLLMLQDDAKFSLEIANGNFDLKALALCTQRYDKV